MNSFHQPTIPLKTLLNMLKQSIATADETVSKLSSKELQALEAELTREKSKLNKSDKNDLYALNQLTEIIDCHVIKFSINQLASFRQAVNKYPHLKLMKGLQNNSVAQLEEFCANLKSEKLTPEELGKFNHILCEATLEVCKKSQRVSL